ncbi:MAG: GTPase domain-containing protein [Nitrospirota bacterium]
MALFNYASKEITLKIVYYGPGLSGKTTNLQQLHSALDPKKTGKLLSLATETDRTLFFDFLPIELGKVKDFSIRFQLYTVPGQVKYNATRKVVLKGADAIVFVADSQRAMREANMESFANMKDNLLSNNINFEDISLVLQYNKRDLPDVLSIDELNKDLNDGEHVYLEAEAVNGKGVQEAFQVATKLLIKDMARKHKLEIQPAAQPEKPAPVSEGVISSPLFEEEKIRTEEPLASITSMQEEIVVIPEKEISEAEVFGEQIISFEEETDKEEKIPEAKPSEAPKESVSEEDFFFTKEPAQPSGIIEMPEVKKETKEEWREPQIREVPVFPVEELDKIRASIKEIPVFPVAKLDKMAEGIKETNQLLVSLKVTIRELSDELRKTKEEQKEILSIIREMKIAETVERIKNKGKKGSWFGMK